MNEVWLANEVKETNFTHKLLHWLQAICYITNMKKLLLIIICFVLGNLSVSPIKAQEYLVIPKPNTPRLLIDKDYANAEPAFIECAKWLKTTDLDKEKVKRPEIERFVFKWIFGSPSYRKQAVYYKRLDSLTENNKALFCVFHANYFRYLIENKKNASHENAIKAGLLSMLFVYNKGIEINKNVQLDHLSKINSSKQLDRYIERYFTSRQAEFGSVIEKEKATPDEPAAYLSEIQDKYSEQNQETLVEDPGGVDNILLTEAKNSKPDADQIFTFVEVMPKFDGDINTYLEQNIKYPPIAFENKIEGKVIVQFVIDKNGNIDKNTLTVLGKKLGWGLEEEALRVVSNMPRWIPGKQKGKAVKVRYIQVVLFKEKR